MPYTSVKEFEDAYSALFATFATGRTKSLAWRKWQLKQCWWMVAENEAHILEALKKDLNRHSFESQASDILGMKKDILEHIKYLEWTEDERPDAGFLFGTLGKARIRREPLGVALIIGAWNFPFLLLLQPLIAAIAAGCCVVLKPSELAEASQSLLERLVGKYLDRSAIRLVTAGPAETGKILERRFNHIFFTGSSKVARFVTAAAAKHLTPVVLELGGQGPAIVTASANVDLAAKRIAYGKFLNAGQICLSVNHVFVDPSIHDELVERLGYWFNQYLDGSYENYVRIVNQRNFDRLKTMLDRTDGKITYGGKIDRDERLIAPTVVTGVSIQDSLLGEELFGPILPIIKMNYKEAYATITSMEHPLAIYIFASKQDEIDEILNNSNSGGVTVNDVLMHAGVPNAPFGGVGDSGYGSYHGKHGFLTFSHSRVVVTPPTWLDKVMNFRYPPYNIANVAKVAVKNKMGFKRGETMADQKIRNLKGPRSIFWRALLYVTSIIVLIAITKSLTGPSKITEKIGRMLKVVQAKLRLL